MWLGIKQEKRRIGYEKVEKVYNCSQEREPGGRKIIIIFKIFFFLTRLTWPTADNFQFSDVIGAETASLLEPLDSRKTVTGVSVVSELHQIDALPRSEGETAVGDGNC